MYKYDVALSYQSESQEFVRDVSVFLTADGWNVYFDLDRKEEMLSQNLKSKLYQIYQNESLLDVLFVTDKYLQSQYTMLEERRALCCARKNAKRVIVVNFMGERLPKELKEFVYLEGSDPSDEIAYRIGERIRELKKAIVSQNDIENTEIKKQTGSGLIQKNVVTNTGIMFGNNANLKNVSFGRNGK